MAKPDSFSTGSAYPREGQGEDPPGGPGGHLEPPDEGEGPSSGPKDSSAAAVAEAEPPIPHYPLMREV